MKIPIKQHQETQTSTPTSQITLNLNQIFIPCAAVQESSDGDVLTADQATDIRKTLAEYKEGLKKSSKSKVADLVDNETLKEQINVAKNCNKVFEESYIPIIRKALSEFIDIRQIIESKDILKNNIDDLKITSQKNVKNLLDQFYKIYDNNNDEKYYKAKKLLLTPSLKYFFIIPDITFDDYIESIMDIIDSTKDNIAKEIDKRYSAELAKNPQIEYPIKFGAGRKSYDPDANFFLALPAVEEDINDLKDFMTALKIDKKDKKNNKTISMFAEGDKQRSLHSEKIRNILKRYRKELNSFKETDFFSSSTWKRISQTKENMITILTELQTKCPRWLQKYGYGNIPALNKANSNRPPCVWDDFVDELQKRAEVSLKNIDQIINLDSDIPQIAYGRLGLIDYEKKKTAIEKNLKAQAAKLLKEYTAKVGKYITEISNYRTKFLKIYNSINNKYQKTPAGRSQDSQNLNIAESTWQELDKQNTTRWGRKYSLLEANIKTTLASKSIPKIKELITELEKNVQAAKLALKASMEYEKKFNKAYNQIKNPVITISK